MAGNTEERGKTKPRTCPRSLPRRDPRHHHNGENENAHPLIEVGAFGCDPTKNGRPSRGRQSVKGTAVWNTSFAPRHIQMDLCLELTETVAPISNRFNGLAQITPDLQPLGQVGGVCSSLLRFAVEINSKCRKHQGCGCRGNMIICRIVNKL